MKGWIIKSLNEKFDKVLLFELKADNREANVSVISAKPLTLKFELKKKIYQQFINKEVVNIAMKKKYLNFKEGVDYETELF